MNIYYLDIDDERSDAEFVNIEEHTDEHGRIEGVHVHLQLSFY